MRSMIIAAFALSVIASPAFAAPCKDAKGKFMKCRPLIAAPAKHCKDARGKFARCGAPGARPV